MSEKHFKSKKIIWFFSICWGGGVNEHMENSICLTVFIFESFPKPKYNDHIIDGGGGLETVKNG